MIPIHALVSDALEGVYGSWVNEFDARGLSPARVSSFVSERVQTEGLVMLLRDLGIALTVLFGVILLFVLLKRRELEQPLPAPAQEQTDTAAMPVPRGPMRPQWERILAQMDSPRENDWRQAVIEADTLADLALAKAGFPGAGLGERLMNIGGGKLATMDGLWWAHKLRNRVAHEVGSFLRYTDARQAIGYYEQTLNELETI
jgi:hypothetical protein